MKKVQGNLVGEFFDSHAVEYREKYSGGDPFYNYFFYERMETATKGMSFEGKRILDIGSGTGGLYDFLVEKGWKFKDFIATDISQGMLDISKVPLNGKKCGDFMNLEFEGKFDYVFLLGVTTYLDPITIKSYLDRISEILEDDGCLIITFTNKTALDTRIRTLVKPLFGPLAGRNRIISQSFNTFYFTESEFQRFWDNSYNNDLLEGLNHTVFPISRVFPSGSINLAKRIHKWKIDWKKRLLSSDILLRLSLR